MTSEEYKKAVDFWKAKECKEMLSDQLKLVVEEFLHNSSICALATETDDYVRCTPLEYSITMAVSEFLPRAERSLLDLRRTRMSVLLSLKKSIF